MEATGLAAAAAAATTATAAATSTRRDYEGEVRDNDPCNEGSVGVTFDAESQKPQKRPSNPSGDAASHTKKRSKTEGGLPVLKENANADEGALSDAGDDADSVASIESIQTIIRRKLFGNPEPQKVKKKKAKKKSANPSNTNLDIETIKSNTGKQQDKSNNSSSSDQEVSPPVLDKPVTKIIRKARKRDRAVDSSSSSVTRPKTKSTRTSSRISGRPDEFDPSAWVAPDGPKVVSTQLSKIVGNHTTTTTLSADDSAFLNESSHPSVASSSTSIEATSNHGEPEEDDAHELSGTGAAAELKEKEPEEDDTNTASDDESLEKEEPCKLRLGETLVQDTDVFASYEILLFSQFNLCRFSRNKDFLFRKKKLYVKENYPGLECKYCLPHLGRRFFYKHKDTMLSHILDLEKHLMRCPGCPATIQEQLRGAKLNGPKERKVLRAKQESTNDDLYRFSTREYVEIMWNRLRSVVNMMEEQEDDKTDMKEKERSVSVEPNPDSILAEPFDSTTDAAGEERRTRSSSSSSSISKSKVNSNDTNNDEESKQVMYPLVDPKTDITSKYNILLFTQVRYCHFDPSIDNVNKFKKIKPGHPGFECKYCPPTLTRRRFFHQSMQNMCTHVANIDKHMMRCPGVPQTIKDQIEYSRGTQEKERSALRSRAGYPPGYGKNRFTKKEISTAVWNRLHAIPRPKIEIAVQEPDPVDETEEIPMNYVKNPKPESIRLVLPTDVSMKYYLLVLSQFDFCQFDPAIDRKGSRNKFLKTYAPGIQCRHCRGAEDEKKFYHGTLLGMFGHGAKIERHVATCRDTPKAIQTKIVNAKVTVKQEQTDFRLGVGLDHW
eukprot:CAMPEP_0198283718 /NCGR_PEP_ID=MMETSP1449-20131203/3301_1 /TAXON_ID=420275 /ORGANISM="Attheya septentrionalis, Strain CCMP2084" /LENGTH=833 /DNA_ID=CAMNT_0043980489 /DNA_START=123 /DNA_END=2621 /DNA_ORIENTATION=+